MSLLDTLPDRCTIQRRVRAKGGLGGSKATATVESTGVHCWEQQASASESEQYEKRGMSLTSKIYFAANPSVTARHQIVVTSRNGTALAEAVARDVLDSPLPDASVGRGLLWRVSVGFNQGEDD